MLSDEAVPGFWRALGLPGLADVHVHFYPERMLRKVWAYFDDVSRYGVDWPITYRLPDADRVAVLERLGVRRFSALSYAHRPGMARELNDWALAFASRTRGCLRSATFFPEPGVLSYVDDALAAGAQLFKVHVQVGDFDPADPRLDEVWGRLADARVPVVVHAGSGPLPGTHTGPGPLAQVLARHPALTAIVAHLGTSEYAEFLELAERYERVCLDTTMAGTDFVERLAPYPRDLLPRLRDLGLAGKVLLGSDFPNIPHPFAHQLEALARWELGDDWLRAVCWGNAAGMFGPMSVYGHSISGLNGDLDLAGFKGKVTLIVNVASKCGLTPQYAGLERLHERFAARGFTVLGVPCNQFGGQEPGSSDEIAEFCAVNYGVTFPMTEKIEVNGESRHPLYTQLEETADASGHSGDIRWNFEKFLIDADGKVVARYSPQVLPESDEVVEAIEELLH